MEAQQAVAAAAMKGAEAAQRVAERRAEHEVEVARAAEQAVSWAAARADSSRSCSRWQPTLRAARMQRRTPDTRPRPSCSYRTSCPATAQMTTCLQSGAWPSASARQRSRLPMLGHRTPAP